MEIHWRAALQVKGFLKFVEMFVAFLALILVASFSVNHSGTCLEFHDPNNPSNIVNGTLKVIVSTTYSFTVASIEVHAQTPTTPYNSSNITGLDSGVVAASQFFVTWAVFTLFYGAIAVAVYMFTTASLQIEWLVNYLVITDLVFHVVWVLCWFIAAVEWAVAQNILGGHMDKIMKDQLNENCTSLDNVDLGSSGYVQAAIGDVFGFAVLTLFAVNIYWVLVDTSFYIQWKASRSSSSSGSARGEGGYDKL